MENKKAGKLVLVVEDEPTIANVLSQVLTFAGFNALQARDGEEALVKVREQKPDIIILDIALPKVDGWEVCRRLKADPETSPIPIVIYSTLSQRKDVEKGKILGASRYISKEKDALEVLEAIKNLLGP
jgi:two-component system phosphate regulon response regulator PhoB/two-component system alkaline phosphatase synthesis response regulator PhoP